MTVAAPERSGSGFRPISRQRLRLWLRLIRCSRAIEAELRERLRVEFKVTMPQFDVMAALARHAGGITMTELSRQLVVSNGNATAIVARLVKAGLVVRQPVPEDRRATIVRLSAKGAAQFASMAAVHEGWVNELMSDFNRAETEAMIGTLDGLLAQVRDGGKRR